MLLDAIETPSAEQFKKVVAAGRPTLIRRAVSDWKAISRWGLDYFEKTVGDRRVSIEFYPSGSYYESRLAFQGSVRRYLDLLREGDSKGKYYLAEVPIDRDLPELWADLSPPAFLNHRRFEFTAFFLGIDTASSLHYHPTTQAMLCQVLGGKKVTLYPPEDFRFLYFNPWYNHWFNFSRIDFDSLETCNFPEFRRATGTVCTLEPGDALFIPMHWGHHVEGCALNSSVTFFWKARLTEWNLRRVAVHARTGKSFRTLVSGPTAKLCERVFGLRIIH